MYAIASHAIAAAWTARTAAALFLAAAGSAAAQCEVATFADEDAPDGAAFGDSAAIDRGVMLLGQNDWFPSDGSVPDAAYAYRFDGTSWALEQELSVQGIAPTDQFGCSVAVSDGFALVGACRELEDGVSGAGAVYVFRHDGAAWVQTQRLVSAAPRADGRFGVWIDVAGDVALILELDPVTVTNDVHAYRRVGASWVPDGTLVPAARQPGDGYGYPVALSPCGRVAAVGAPYDAHAGANSGAAYVFRRDGAQWVEDARLTAADAEPSDFFGIGVSVDRDTVAAGAFGGLTNAGAAYVFGFDGAAWTERAKLTNGDPDRLDWFGHHVAVRGDVLAVSAEGPYQAAYPGAVHVFRRAGGAWGETVRLEASDPSAGDWFGNGIALDGDHLAVSAAFNDRHGSDTGAAFLYAGLAGVDYDGNGVADVCDRACPADVDGDGEIGFDDLLRILAGWGACP